MWQPYSSNDLGDEEAKGMDNSKSGPRLSRDLSFLEELQVLSQLEELLWTASWYPSGPRRNFGLISPVGKQCASVKLVSDWCCGHQMRTVLYGKKAANLYTQAFVQNTQARALYQESEDTYYRANDAASYDDWRRARHQWDYFYNRH